MSNVRFVNSDPNKGKNLLGPCPKGCNWGECPDCPWLTIQFSVDELAKIGGGILHVALRQYDENVVMSGKQYSDITIMGDPTGPSSSPFDAVFCEVRPKLVAKNPQKPTIFIERADNVRLQDLCITNGNHGVHANDVKNLKIITCCINNNTATTEAGGGFLVEQSREVLVRGCRIFSNQATDPNAGLGGGGTLDKCEEVTVEGCYFHANQAGLAGGGLRVSKSPKKTRVTIEDNIFGDKDAKSPTNPPASPSPQANIAPYGGSISVDFCPDVDLRIGVARANSHFMNEAKAQGGAVAIEMSHCKIGQDQFYRNRAAKHGGAMHINNAFDVEMTGTVLEKNEALGGDGGGIWVEADDSTPGKLTLDSVRLDTNKADNDGGGVYCYFSVTLKITGSKFTDNTAGNAGGGLYYAGDDKIRKLDVGADTVFDHNTAGADAGGGCFIKDAEGTVTDCRFTRNQATTLGGGLYFVAFGARTAAFLKLEYSRFQDNQAASGGGAYIKETVKGLIRTNDVVNNKGGLYFVEDEMKALGVVNNTLRNNISKAGALEDLISERDVHRPKLTQAQLVAANIVQAQGVIVK